MKYLIKKGKILHVNDWDRYKKKDTDLNLQKITWKNTYGTQNTCIFVFSPSLPTL